MLRRGQFAIGLLLAGIAAPGFAQDKQSTKPEDVVVTGKIPDADKKVCTTEASTGSIIPKRTCRTKGEWEAMRARSLANLERMKADQNARKHTQDSVENR